MRSSLSSGARCRELASLGLAMLLVCAVTGSTYAADETDAQASWFATGSFDEQNEFESSKVTFRFDGNTLTGSGRLGAGDRSDEGEWARVDITFVTEHYPDPGHGGCFRGSATLHHTGAHKQNADLVSYDFSDEDSWEACPDEGVLEGRLHDSDLSFEAQQIGAEKVGALLDDVRLSPPATAAPVEPTPSLEPPVQEAARDLWLHEGDTVTRVDHLTGEILDRWDVSHPDCPSGRGGQPFVQLDGDAAWLTIVDAESETPVLECLIRLPFDGSASLEAYPVATGREPTFVNDAATHGGDLWAVTWKKTDLQGTLEYYADWSLARLDRWAGSLAEVLPRVVALAPTDAGLVVLYSRKGAKEGARRPLLLGIVEPGGKAPRKIPLDAALPRTKRGTYVTPRLRLSAGLEGSVALYDELAARNIIVFDPASGAVLGEVAPPKKATAMGPVWPVSGGVWMSGLLDGGDDFVRYAPFDGASTIDIDPCAGVAGDCYAQVETASDAGAWVSAWPYDDAFEVNLDRVVMRRYDTNGQPLVEVAGTELFGTG